MVCGAEAGFSEKGLSGFHQEGKYRRCFIVFSFSFVATVTPVSLSFGEIVLPL
jgi:hypothetical protein